VEARAAMVLVWGKASAPVAFLGDLFIRALKMIIAPLIIASVVTGIGQMGDASRLGRIGWRTMVYYGLTTLLAVVAGIALVNIIQPGVGLEMAYEAGKVIKPKPLSEVFGAIIPTSMLGAWSANDMLPTIFTSMLLGLAILVCGEAAKPLARLFEAGNVVILRITGWIMACAPVGVGALLAATLLDPKLADVGTFLQNLGAYMLTVILGLSVHAAITLPLILWVVTRRSPLAYARALSTALLTAFSTASSSATYPVTLEGVTTGAGVTRSTANFVLPLGATVNMDGTALYEAVAAVFIANVLGVDLSFQQQIIVVVTATLAAIGAAGVPSAGLVTMIIVLEAVGLPPEAYGLVVAVDRLLDMCRTTVNVWGDAVGAAVVDRWAEVPAGEEAA
jgi:Na+/H+-dicarboxylate symporter